MDWKWVLLMPHIISLYITLGSEVVVQVNTKKWIYYVPERFLSLSVDPLTLAAASPLTQESFNMAKGLSPSFVRIGGIGTSALIFGKEFMVNSSTVSESQWDSVNDFARGTGLDIIASLNPSIQVQGVWDSQNSLELISYSNKKRHNVVWQLGYDVRGYNASGAEIGRDLVRLAKILDGFPKYAGSPVFGPDISSVSGAKQVHFVKDLMTNAGNTLGALILQPKFLNDGEPEDCHELMTSMISELDTYVWNKEVRLGKAIPKKPVWIAEPTASKGSFGEAMQLVKRLGVAARIGIQIYMRQAGAISLKSQTPEFWFSLLYKNLVGQGVLDNKIISQNQSDLHVFAHCAASVPQEKSILDTDWNYEKGAVTLFGVNDSPGSVKLGLKVTNKEEPLHIFVLTSDTKNEAGDNPTTLLNGQELRLSPTWDLPVLSPKVKRPNKSASVVLPGRSIFFIVMPDSKIRTCSIPPLATPDFNLSELSKRLRLGPSRRVETLEEEEEIEPSEDPMNEGVYVAFAKKKRHDTEAKNDNVRADVIGKSLMQTLISKLAPKKIERKTTNRPVNNEEMPVYITFNENSFLNKLAEGVKEELKEEDQQEIDTKKYAPLTAAMSLSKPETTSQSSEKSAETTDEDVDVIKIEPLVGNANTIPVVGSNHENSGYRIRRSSNEDPPPGSASLEDKEPMGIIKKINEYKKTGATKDGEVGDIARSLDQVTVSFTKSEDDPDQIGDRARSTRHIGGGTDEEPDDGNVENISGAKQVSVGDQVNDKEKYNDDDDDVTKKTAALVKVVQETEKVQSVSESPGSVMIPPCVSEDKLGEIMLETAKLTSEPETEPDNVPKEERSSEAIIGATVPQMTSETEVQGMSSKPGLSPPTENSPAKTLEEPQPIALSTVFQPRQIQSNYGGQNVPIVTIGETPGSPVLAPQSIQEQQIISIPAQIRDNHILKIPISTPPRNTEPNEILSGVTTEPTVMSPVSPDNPVASFYNEQKETAINNILTKIVNEEESKLSKMSSEDVKPPNAGGSNLVTVPLPGNDTILMAPDDVMTINKDQEVSDGIKTLENHSPPIEIANEDDRPSVKVMRQIGAKTLRLSVTPLSQTATLSAPVEQAVSSTPAGPVSPFKTPVNSNKPMQTNQIRENLKAPSPEELRERFKSLREKMLELRSQYMAARDKRLEDIKKQVAARAPSPASEPDETIKSTIKRREAELKEWFKKFDKRETPPNQVVPVEEEVKPRPRRLSLFSNNEGLDMAKFFDEEPSESYNYKRSSEMSSQSKHQDLPIVPNGLTLPKVDPMRKHIFPLDTKTHGIVYNNKIYPAKLFGYIDHSDLENSSHKGEQVKDSVDLLPTEDRKLNDEEFKGSVKDVETSMEIPKSRERIAFVPRDAFVREMKSDFIPVIIMPPDESEEMKIEDLPLGRAKRSTLDSLEDQFHQLKEDLLPKISSWIKNLSENPPWKRDLERSSRNRRSIENILKTNDLRSLLIPRIPTRKYKEMKLKAIEDLVVDKIDKGEDEIYATAKKYGGLAEKITDQVLEKESVEPESNARTDNPVDMGFCEEIGTSKQSIITDPFDMTTVDLKAETKDDTSKLPTETSGVKTTKTDEVRVAKTPTSSSDTFEDSMIASVVAGKIKDFLEVVKSWMEIPPTYSTGGKS